MMTRGLTLHLRCMYYVLSCLGVCFALLKASITVLPYCAYFPCTLQRQTISFCHMSPLLLGCGCLFCPSVLFSAVRLDRFWNSLVRKGKVDDAGELTSTRETDRQGWRKRDRQIDRQI